MKNKIKLSALKWCRLAGRTFNPPGIPILAYHSVADDQSVISTPCQMFKLQMKYLKRHGYRVVSLQTLLSLQINKKPIPREMVVLTFDDGLKDFYQSAWPVLKNLNFSATVFVPTDYIGDESRWYAQYGLTPVPMLNWNQITELSDDNVDIQSHGCSHRPLTELDTKDLQKELYLSKEILENRLGKAVNIFCCPQGAENKKVRNAIQNAGYQMGIGGESNLFYPDTDIYNIKRQALDYINLNDEQTAILSMEACLDGGFAWYVNSRKKLKNLLGIA